MPNCIQLVAISKVLTPGANVILLGARSCSDCVIIPDCTRRHLVSLCSVRRGIADPGASRSGYLCCSGVCSGQAAAPGQFRFRVAAYLDSSANRRRALLC
jgi:hypothetical protein